VSILLRGGGGGGVWCVCARARACVCVCMYCVCATSTIIFSFTAVEEAFKTLLLYFCVCVSAINEHSNWHVVCINIPFFVYIEHDADISQDEWRGVLL